MRKYRLYMISILLFCIPASAYSFDLPEPSYPVGSETIKGLNPVFKWDPADIKGVKYDLVIFKPGLLGLPNKPIFYKENISKTEYQLPVTLERKTKYIWFLRARENNKVTAWRSKQFFIPYVVNSILFSVVAAIWNQPNDNSFITE